MTNKSSKISSKIEPKLTADASLKSLAKSEVQQNITSQNNLKTDKSVKNQT